MEIEAAPVEVRVEKRGVFTVAIPTTGGAALTSGTVDDTLRQIRAERGTDA